MAQIATITTNTNAIAPALTIRTSTLSRTFVGVFSYEVVGTTFNIFGSNTAVSLALASDTVSVNSVSCTYGTIVTEIDKAFVK